MKLYTFEIDGQQRVGAEHEGRLVDLSGTVPGDMLALIRAGDGALEAADARLVVEVSDTTLRLDRGRKRTAYARAGVLEYWILNLPERQLEAHREPSGLRYRSITIYGEQETITPLAAPDSPIGVHDLLPPEQG